jgi:hypothetical protein
MPLVPPNPAAALLLPLLLRPIQIIKHLEILLRPTANISDDRFAVLTVPLPTIQVFWDDNDDDA